MSSRRSRLKAVANLPVRRKPNFSEQDSGTQNQDEDSKVEQTVKEEGVSSPTVVTDPEPEPVATVPTEPTEQCVKEKQKARDAPSKFFRRIKPTVNIPSQREKKTDSCIDRNEGVSVEKHQICESDKSKDESEFSQSAHKISVRSESEQTSTNITSDSVDQCKTVKEVQVERNQRSVTTAPAFKSNISKSLVVSSDESTPAVFVKPSNVEKEPRKVNDDVRKVVSVPSRIRTLSDASNTVKDVSIHGKTLLEESKKSESVPKRKRPKCNDVAQKLAHARRDFQKRCEKMKPDRTNMKMIDLIFYNPTSNPMESKAKPEKCDSKTGEDEDLLSEAKVDDPDSVESQSDGKNTSESVKDESDDLTHMPVPQVKIGLNGEIILDEKSLIIETTEAKRGREDLQNAIPIFEDKGNKASYYCRRTKKTKDWSDSETKRLYKALNTIGTDFLLMQQLFPNRSRLELKNKFKREEKLNRSLIDKALNNPSEFDMTQLLEDLTEEKRAEEKELEEKQQRQLKNKKSENKKPRSRNKSSWLLREMTENDTEAAVDGTEIELAKSEKVQPKKMNDTDLLVQKLLKHKPAIQRNSSRVQTMQLAGDVSVNNDVCNETRKHNSNSYIVIKHREFKSQKRKLEPAVDEASVGLANQDEISVSIDNSPNEDLFNSESEKASTDLSETTTDFQEAEKLRDELSSGKHSKKRVIGKKPKSKKDKSETVIYPLNDKESDVATNSDELIGMGIKESSAVITDSHFLQLLAHNVENLKETTVDIQSSVNCGTKIEVIFDNVPPISYKDIEDQNITVIADYRTLGSEEEPERPRVPNTDPEFQQMQVDENQEVFPNHSNNETSVIVENPNVIRKQETFKNIDYEEFNESNDYSYMMVEEVVENSVDSERNVLVDDLNSEQFVTSDNSQEETTIENCSSDMKLSPDPALVVCNSSESNKEKMYLANLAAGSFVLMSNDLPDSKSPKTFTMYMISEKTQSDGTSVMSSMPVMLPPELIPSITQELNCS